MTPLEAAHAAIDAHVPDGAMEEESVHKTIAKVMVEKYNDLYLVSNWKPLSVEREVYAPLINPATKAKSRTWLLGGRVDVDIENLEAGEQGIIDHKTCSEEIADENAAYWQRLRVESQLSHYALLNWINARKLDGILWDVVRRPLIRPKAIPKTSKDGPTIKSVLETNEYYGRQVSRDAISHIDAAVEAGDKVTETLELYGYRLRHLLDTETSKYFQRKWIGRIDSDLMEYAREVWQTGQSMLRNRKAEIHPRSPESCMEFGRPCEYLGICSGSDSPDSDNWYVRETCHSELEKDQEQRDATGLEILTNSRIRCDRTCQRKHHYRYDQRLRRVDVEPVISLQFGNLWHSAMNAWYAAQIERTDNVDNDDRPEEVVLRSPSDSEQPAGCNDHPW